MLITGIVLLFRKQWPPTKHTNSEMNMKKKYYVDTITSYAMQITYVFVKDQIKT